MISLLQGKVISNQNNEVTLLTSGGVGYALRVSPTAATLCIIDKEVTLECYLVVREDTLDLFGFASKGEKGLFKHFLSVSGVGPKTALHLLSLGSVEEITLAVGRSDLDYLTKVSGIGKKTAERIVLELRAKLKDTGFADLEAGGDRKGDVLGEILDALVTMGYSVIDARETVQRLKPEGKTSEVLLREALRIIK